MQRLASLKFCGRDEKMTGEDFRLVEGEREPIAVELKTIVEVAQMIVTVEIP